MSGEVIENPMAVEGEAPAAAAEPTEAELIAEYEKGVEAEKAPSAVPAPAEKPATPAAAAKPADPSSAPAAPPAEDEEGLPTLERLLRAKEREKAERASANVPPPVDPEKEAYRKELAEMRAWRAEREKDFETTKAERERLNEAYAALKSDPVKFIKGAGWGADDLVNNVARAGTPEWQAEQALKAQLAEANAKLSKFDQFVEESKQQRQTWTQQNQQNAVENIYREFLTEHMRPEKAPNTRAVALTVAKATGSTVDRVLRTMGDDLYNHVLKETGQHPSLGDIAQRLEWQASRELAELRSSGGDSKATNGSAPKASAANGSRTLGAAAASERRASTKPYHEMTAAEQRNEDIRIYAEAERLAATQ